MIFFEMMADKPLPQFLEGNKIIDSYQFARLKGVSIATLRRQKARGLLPAEIKLSDRRIGWRVADVLQHIDSLKVGGR